MPTLAQWAAAEIVLPQPKKSIALRVDPEIIAFFKQGGPGYQTRMVGVLREYVRLSGGAPRGKPRAPPPRETPPRRPRMRTQAP
jgi:hypothetical protein